MFDPRFETIVLYLRKVWFFLPRFLRNSIWFLLKTSYKFVNFFKKLSISRDRNNQIVSTESELRVVASAPTDKDWSLLKSLDRFSISAQLPFNEKGPTIDVIIPVYEGFEETLRCIYSVLNAKTSCSFCLVIIDDNSPNTKLVKAIEELSKEFSCIKLIKNPSNWGFVKSTNFGMSLHKDRDVVWLNSDTEVFDFWLDRLKAIAFSNDTIATVTPLSNNATICSYPYINRDNCKPLESDDSNIDKLAAFVNEGVSIETPTGVGFCMFIKRKALDEVGLLNESVFGRGYGEENDLCQRFKKQGWSNVITPSVFVRHYGATSFKFETVKRCEDAYKKVLALHPRYGLDVDSWIRADNLRKYRARLDLARYKQWKGLILENFKERVLIINHSLGGGTDYFVKKLCEHLKSEGSIGFILKPDAQGRPSLLTDEHLFPNLYSFDTKYESDILLEICRSLQITHIHINHTVGFVEDFIDSLIEVHSKTNIPLIYTLHDYFVFCPFFNLKGPNETACINVDLTKCSQCTKQWGTTPAFKHRKVYKRLLDNSSKVTVPCLDQKLRVQKVFPELNIEVMPHRENFILCTKTRESYRHLTNKVMRIGFIGAIAEGKGSAFIKDFAEYIRSHSILNVELYVLGFTDRDSDLRSLGVQILGHYQSEQTVQEWIVEKKINRIMIPSVWPETYCYTLSIALRTGLPTFTFDIGALKERMDKLGRSDFCIPLNQKNNFEFIISMMRRKELSDQDALLMQNENVKLPREYYVL